MALILYYHPFSSYCQKVLIALYEKELPFQPYLINLADERQRGELAAIWPYARFPVLHDVDAAVTLPESTLIIDYLDGLGTGEKRLVPADPVAARAVRLADRTLDQYLHAPLQKLVNDRLRPEERRDPAGVEEARGVIAATYRLFERRLGSDGWMAGDDFSLADCAALPPLFYVSRLVPLASHPRLAAYLERGLERPSFRRCVEGGRPYRHFFPAASGDGPWPGDDRPAEAVNLGDANLGDGATRVSF